MQVPQLSNPRHLGALFFCRVAELGDRPSVKLQRGERFEEISWRDFGSKVSQAILGLALLGLNHGERVAIIGENSLPWLCADMATLAGGFPNVVASPSVSVTMLLKMLGQSRCRAAFVENETSVGRLLNLKGQLPALQHIIVMNGASSGLANALTFDQLLERGAGQNEKQLSAILESIHPENLASIMYTSG